MWSVLENVQHALEKYMYSAVFGWYVLKISINSIWFNMLFNASIGLLKFCLDDLFINVRGVLKCHTGKESAHDTGDLGSILGLGRSSGEGKGNPLQYSGL